MLREVLLFTSLIFAAAQQQNGSKCSCGVFGSLTPATTEESPLIMKSPNFEIKCDNSGMEACAKMCVALAEAARDKAPQVLCQTLGKTDDPFTPQVYSKTCDEQAWTNTGLHSTLKVCCSANAPISCPEEISPSSIEE